MSKVITFYVTASLCVSCYMGLLEFGFSKMWVRGGGGGEAQLGRQGLKGDLLAFLIAMGLKKTN